jgi:hypothetical protein
VSLQTYKGSCHCGRVRFEADIDLDQGTGKCNCSICTKSRNWGVILKPDAFRLLAGEDALSDYQWGHKVGHRLFCSSCGIASFGRGYVEQIGGDYVSVAVNCLDDLDPSVLAQAPVRYMDGRHDNWFEPPSETRHL